MAGNWTKSDSEKLLLVLKELGIVEIYQYLIDYHITYRSLEYLSKEDLMVIPHVGLRAEFREKLFKFREKNIVKEERLCSLFARLQNTYPQQDQEKEQTKDLSVYSSQGLTDHHQDDTNDQENEPTENLGACSKPQDDTHHQEKDPIEDLDAICLDYQEIFQNSDEGKKILTSYEKRIKDNDQLLTEDKRRKIANIILDGLEIEKGKILYPKDFDDILKSITKMFPTEEKFKEFYYIPSKNGNSPKGYLYHRYRNLRSAFLKREKNKEKEMKKGK